jgi:glycosyltransferase involved in cell wall biosynthesis
MVSYEKVVLKDGGTRVNTISIICMFKNNEQYLKNFFFDIVNQFEDHYDATFNYYVIENNSKDNTRQLLKDFFKKKNSESKLLLFNMKEDFKNIGDGKNFERLFNLAKIRNKLVDNIVPLNSEWCLFIDSNIFFKKDILEKCFACSPTENNIGMMIPYTQQMFIPEIHKLPNLTKPTLLSHFYDTFSFYDTNNKTFWPYCAFEKCKSCKREDCMDRKSIPKEQDIVDVSSSFSGFCLINTEIINNKLIRWDTLSHEVKKDESVCEHFLFCNMLRKLTQKRIVVLQSVDDIYRTF